MRYGRIAGNKSINAAIYRCCEHISEEDARTFARKFREQPHDQNQVMHTFRELILGGFLASSGLNAKYDRSICGKTPDWSILDSDGGLQGFFELVNFHPDRVTEDAITQHWKSQGIWCGWSGSHATRLYSRIRDKASTYKELVEQAKVWYVVALFGEFTADVSVQEVDECLFVDETGIFSLYPHMSGLLFFVENSGRYRFTYHTEPWRGQTDRVG
jgi:hypothetical protein